jgi:hypothetical protein
VSSLQAREQLAVAQLRQQEMGELLRRRGGEMEAAGASHFGAMQQLQQAHATLKITSAEALKAEELRCDAPCFGSVFAVPVCALSSPGLLGLCIILFVLKEEATLDVRPGKRGHATAPRHAPTKHKAAGRVGVGGDGRLAATLRRVKSAELDSARLARELALRDDELGAVSAQLERASRELSTLRDR